MYVGIGSCYPLGPRFLGFHAGGTQAPNQKGATEKLSEDTEDWCEAPGSLQQQCPGYPVRSAL